MREVERLLRLQQVDDEIRQCRKQLPEWAGRREERQQILAEARHSCKEREKALPHQEKRIRQAERSVREMETRLKKLKKRLYSDAIRSIKEAGALRAEIEQLDGQKSAVEDEALQLLLDLDDMRADLEEALGKVDHRVEEYEAIVRKAEAQETALHQQIEQLQTTRAERAAGISPKALSLYERLCRTGSELAVVRVENKTCQGCRLEVALLTRKAARGDELVRCENCGCILYI